MAKRNILKCSSALLVVAQLCACSMDWGQQEPAHEAADARVDNPAQSGDANVPNVSDGQGADAAIRPVSDAGADAGEGGRPCTTCPAHAHCGDAMACECDVNYEPDGQGNCIAFEDNCLGHQCLHGAKCLDGPNTYRCDCSATGYSGSRCETDVDECGAPNLCTSAYPCRQTAAPGYTCEGQLAGWPMPDAVSTAKQRPDYDTTSTTGVVIDRATGIWWEHAVTAKVTLSDAISHCKGLKLGGRSDWRVPSKIELESVLDVTRTESPLIDLSVFPGTPGDFFWTSSPSPDLSYPSTWAIDLDNAQWGLKGATSLLYLRCVRSAPESASTPERRYVATDDSVIDTRTGLIWQRGTIPSQGYTWADAQLACAGLSGGFRLPTLKELLTLVDPTKRHPAVNSEVFPDTAGTEALDGYWTSVQNALATVSADFAWTVNFLDGTGERVFKTQKRRVRCVR